MQPFLGRLTSSLTGFLAAASASAWVTAFVSAIRCSTVLRRRCASFGSLTGSYRLGDCTMPASSADSSSVRSLACLLKYRWDAASTPYACCPKKVMFR